MLLKVWQVQLQLKDTESAIKSNPIDLLAQLKGLKFRH